MKRWIWIVPLLFLIATGCTKQGNTERSYEDIAPMRITNSGDNSFTNIYIAADLMGASEQAQEMGDASAQAKLPVAIALKGAQGSAGGDESGVEGNPVNIEPIDASNRPVTTTTPVPTPAPVPVPDNNDNNDSSGPVSDNSWIDDPEGIDLMKWDPISEQALCDDNDPPFTYRHSDEGTAGIKQLRCRFEKEGSEYGDQFIVYWSDGEKLAVPDSSKMSWVFNSDAPPRSDERDFRKYQPNEEGQNPGTPAEVYAARGTSPKWAVLLGKKTEADCAEGVPSDRSDYKCMIKVEHDGSVPDLANKKFSRCQWTDTTGDWAFLQRKFNFTKNKPTSPVLVVFEGGPEVKVTNTGNRHYPGAAGHVKWGVPKLDDGNECKHYYSIAAPKDSNPDYAILYYN